MKIVTILILGLSLLFSQGCGRSSDREKHTITISGAFALYPMAMKWKEEYTKLNPHIVIEISGGGAGKGMTDALSRVVDIGMVSRDIAQAEIEKGAFWVSVAKDAVVPVTSDRNPFLAEIRKKGITRETFSSIWISFETKLWSEAIGVNFSGPNTIGVYTRSDACGAAETWAKYLLGNNGRQEDLNGTGIFGDPGIGEAVSKDPLGIGYTNVNFGYDSRTKKPFEGLAIIPIDLNGNGEIDQSENFYATRDGVTKAIAEGIYPSPPARDLHFVTQGVPEKQAVIDFLVWVLTEGQQYVGDSGYIKLSDEHLKKEIGKLGVK